MKEASKESVRVNGVSIPVQYWKQKTEQEFVEHEKHHFNGDTKKTSETWKMFQEQVNKNNEPPPVDNKKVTENKK